MTGRTVVKLGPPDIEKKQFLLGMTGEGSSQSKGWTKVVKAGLRHGVSSIILEIAQLCLCSRSHFSRSAGDGCSVRGASPPQLHVRKKKMQVVALGFRLQ